MARKKVEHTAVPLDGLKDAIDFLDTLLANTPNEAADLLTNHGESVLALARKSYKKAVKAVNMQEELVGIADEAQEAVDVLAEDSEEAGYLERARNATQLAMRIRIIINKAKRP